MGRGNQLRQRREERPQGWAQSATPQRNLAKNAHPLSLSFCPPPPSPPSEGIYGVAEWMGVMPSSPSSLSPSQSPLSISRFTVISPQLRH